MINSIGISLKGRIGGLTLLKKYGRNHFVKMGQSGGRPRIDANLPRLTQEVNQNKKDGGMPGKANNLETLRILWKRKQVGATGNSQSGSAK